MGKHRLIMTRAALAAMLILALSTSFVFAQDTTPGVVPTETPTETVEPTDDQGDIIVITATPSATPEGDTATETAPTAITPTDVTTAQPTATQPGGTGGSAPLPTLDNGVYVVTFGDTLSGIARRFQTTVTALVRENGIVNPNLIFVGQRLTIPDPSDPQPNPGPEPTATPLPAGFTYLVQPGDTLYRIALRFNTTVAELVQINNITNPNLIYWGTRLLITPPDESASSSTPGSDTAAQGAPPGTSSTDNAQDTAQEPSTDGSTLIPTTSPGDDSAQTPPLEQQTIAQPAETGFALFPIGADLTQVTRAVNDLNAEWVRVDVLWRELELTQGSIDFAALDPVINALDESGTNIMLTIYTAPDWARTSLVDEGPPDNIDAYSTFVGALANRYRDQVDAYQIWDAPNLRSSWNSDRYNINAISYFDLLASTYNIVKTFDTNAQVITAGLAPVGDNPGRDAINEQVYLQNLYLLGLPTVSDGVALNPGTFANAPDARCCGTTGFTASTSNYFLDSLDAYRATIAAAGDTRPLWITALGWGSAEGLNAPDAESAYIAEVSQQEQAEYLTRALELLSTAEGIGPVFIYNLNGCTAGAQESQMPCYFSLVGPDGSPRPAYLAVTSGE